MGHGPDSCNVCRAGSFIFAGRIRRADGRNVAQLAMASQVSSQISYVLGWDTKGKPTAEPIEIPPECGVIIARDDGLEVMQAAPRQPLMGSGSMRG